MIFDAHCYLGHLPFRPLRHNTPEGLKAFLNKSGVDRALVANLNGIFYRDVSEGNEELHAWLQQAGPGVAGSFEKACVVNPAYPGWQADARRFVQELGFKAIQLYPAYHQYSLAGPEGLAALDLAAQLKVPVHLPYQLEDIRQKHWMDVERQLDPEDVKAALTKIGTVDVIITNGFPIARIAEVMQDVKRQGRVLYDFCRLKLYNNAIDQLIDMAGIDNIVFASEAPMQYIEPQLVKMENLKRPEADKEKIYHKNLAGLLG